MEKYQKLSSIQGLRGLAVVLVILYHFELAFPNGYLGVDLFFVVSGFVISRLIHSQLAAETFSFGSFYFSRFMRLFPALSVVVIFTIGISAVVSNKSSFEVSWSTGMSALLGVSNVTAQLLSADYFATDSRANSLLHTWSLGVEEQFYLVLPLALYFLYSRSRNFRLSALTAVSTASLVSFALFISPRAWGEIPYVGAFLGYYSPVVRVWEFGAGVAVYLISLKSKALPPLITRLLVTVGLLLSFFASSFSPTVFGVSARWATVLVVVGTSLVILSQSDPDKQSRALSWRPLTWLGERSYSLYLWHWPLLVLGQSMGLTGVAATIGTLITVGLTSFISHRFFEQKARSFQVKNSRPLLAAASILLSLGLASAAGPLAAALLSAEGVANDQRLERPYSYEAGCHDKLIVCFRGVPTNDVPSTSAVNVYLVGDSNAAHHLPGIELASANIGLDVFSLTASGCSGLRPELNRNEEKILACKSYSHWIRSELSNMEPGIVILGFSMQYVEEWGQSQKDSLDSIRASLHEFETFSLETGHSLIIAEPIPHWTGKYPHYEPDLLPRVALSRITNPYQSWKQDYGDIKLLIGKESALVTNVFQTHELLCVLERCTIFDSGKFLFQDATHITVYASEQMSSEWQETLERHIAEMREVSDRK